MIANNSWAFSASGFHDYGFTIMGVCCENPAGTKQVAIHFSVPDNYRISTFFAIPSSVLLRDMFETSPSITEHVSKKTRTCIEEGGVEVFRRVTRERKK